MAPIDVARSFANDLSASLGDTLRSVSLFGSTARGEHIAEVSDVNVLVLVEDIEPRSIARIAPALKKYEKQRLNPLLLEQAGWARAHDVFAIELSDMIDAHTVLAGADPVAGVTVAQPALRLQAERELRAKLIALHAGLLRGARSPDAIGDLLRAALPSFATYLRAALRLAGHEVPAATADVIEAGCPLVGAVPAGMMAALEARKNPKRWTAPLDGTVVAAYNDAAERTAAFVDRHQSEEITT